MYRSRTFLHGRVFPRRPAPPPTRWDAGHPGARGSGPLARTGFLPAVPIRPLLEPPVHELLLAVVGFLPAVPIRPLLSATVAVGSASPQGAPPAPAEVPPHRETRDVAEPAR
jgi:hypothetical protein